MSDHLEELETLLLEWEDGTLDDRGVDRVREMLRNDKDARKHFAQMQTLSAALKLEGDLGLNAGSASMIDSTVASVIPASVKRKRSPSEHVLRISYWFAASAAALICIMAARLAYLEFIDNESGTRKVAVELRDKSQEATASGVALLTRLVDAEWGEGSRPAEVGDALMPGTFAIESGFAQVEFFCGATVILEGPAEIELASETLARVRHGRLRAQVPPAARGFSLEVDDMKVVDLGTEFGLSVTPDGTDVQVFDGEVELHGEDDTKRLLTAGQAVLRNSSGGFQEKDATPSSFVDVETLESRAVGQQAERYQRWKSWSEELRRDERLLAYYAFDQNGGWKRRLQSSVQPVNSELDGAIVGAHCVVGRWGSKRALEFKRPGDRVRVEIPGEYSSLTFACWVKIDSLDRWYNSLFLTDNYNQGEPHWQILDTGQLFFSVRVKSDDDEGPEHRKVLSPPFWNPTLSGKWLHLATKYDVEEKSVTHYLNGEVLCRETIPDVQLATKTRFGRSTIGNWSSPQRPDADFAIRNLNGRIDELAIFAAALADDEIKEMYDYGKP